MHKPYKCNVIHHMLQLEPNSIAVGSIEWYAWLAQHTRFSFEGKTGHFTAQRETRRQKTFWYGYRRRGGKLYKQYLGKSEYLTAERLEQVSAALAGQNLLERYANQPVGGADSGFEARIDSSLLPKTKVNIPALPRHLVARLRLTRQINTPLTLISAPSGFGKSTLLNHWSRSVGYPAAWLSLDANDNQPSRFWCSVIMAVQTIHPDFGKELLADLQASTNIQFSEVITRLTNDIVSMQSTIAMFGLVLDDFHHITHKEIFESIQFWLDHFPQNLQLVFSGHTKPPLSLGHLRARGNLTELDASDLRFTLEEGLHFLQQYPQEPPLAHTDLEKLVKHTEGWAAGLTLAVLALNKNEDHRQFIDTFSGAHIYLREFFMETVFQHSRPEVQAFLLKTAILKHLNGPLCDAVTGQAGSEDILQHLWEENLFIDRLEEQGWYRYHELFAEMLLSQLQARSPEEVPLLHQRAAQWYCEQNAPADAVYHLLEIDAWEEAASLIETMALRELEQYGEDSRLLRWLQELPEDVVQKHKTLLFVYLRLADVALPKEKMERFIAHIETNLSRKRGFQQTEDERDVLAEIQHIQFIWEQGGSYTLPTQSSSENVARWEVLNGLHLLKSGLGSYRDNWENQIVRLLDQAQARPNLFVILMAGGVYARQTFVNGQLRRSEKIARQVLEKALLQCGKLPEPASISLAVLSQIHLEQNNLDLAQRYLMQAQEVDPSPTSTNMPVQFAILRAKIQAAQGKMDDALANLHAIRDLHARRPSGMWTNQDLLAYEALLFLRKGDPNSAEELLERAESGEAHGLLKLARAMLLLQKNLAGDAERQLTQLVSQYPGGIYFEPIMGARLQLALALFANRKINQALQVMIEAVRLAAPERFLLPFVESGAGCIPLLLLTQKAEKMNGDAQFFIKEVLGLLGHGGGYPQAELEALSTSASISQREQEVLYFLTNGLSNNEIAEELYISKSTVKTHLRNIYDKLGVKSRTQAVKRTKELNLI